MGAHHLDYERSLALHAAVARKLRADPSIRERALAKLREWQARGGRSATLWSRWEEVLDQPVDAIAAFLTSPTEEAAWLRKASPFAGVLSPQERVAILREVRQRLQERP